MGKWEGIEKSVQMMIVFEMTGKCKGNTNNSVEIHPCLKILKATSISLCNTNMQQAFLFLHEEEM